MITRRGFNRFVLGWLLAAFIAVCGVIPTPNTQSASAQILAGIMAGNSVVAPTLPQSARIVYSLSASSLVLSNGAPVTSWADSVHSVTATNRGSGATNPTYIASSLGGKPSVRFNQTLDTDRLGFDSTGLAVTTAINSGTYTVIMVARTLSAASGGAPTSPTSYPAAMLGTSNGGSGFIMLADYTYMGRFNGGNSVAAPTNGNTLSVVGLTFGLTSNPATGGVIERNSVNGSVVSQATQASPTISGTDFVLGAINITSNFAYTNVDIFDMLVYDVELTPTELFQATNYYFTYYAQAPPWNAGTKIVVYDGDSITAGVGADVVAHNYPYLSAQALGLAYGQWTNMGVGSSTATQMQTKIPTWSGIGPLTGKNLRVAAFEYFNQQQANAAAITSYATAVRALPNTKLALGTSTSSCSDNPTGDATRTSFNSFLVTNQATYSDSFVSLHTNASIGLNGATGINSFSVNGFTDSCSATIPAGLALWFDGVHLDAAGDAILAPLFTTGISAIP